MTGFIPLKLYSQIQVAVKQFTKMLEPGRCIVKLKAIRYN